MQSGESRGDGEGPEQKVTLRGEGKADGRQGFSGRQAFPTARMSQVSANPPTAQSPRGRGQCFPGTLSKPSPSLPPSQPSPINQAGGDGWGRSLGLASGNYRLGQKVC